MSAYKESAVLEYLEFVDLSYNELRHDASEMYTAATMPRLRTIILDHNSDLDICRLDYFTDQCKFLLIILKNMYLSCCDFPLAVGWVLNVFLSLLALYWQFI